MGKIYYKAPEIVKGIPYDNRIDIYSLGCIIYELFTLNEYFIDKFIDEKDGKINIELYNPKYQDLIESLLKKKYSERPYIEEVIKILNEIDRNIQIVKNEYPFFKENNNSSLKIFNDSRNQLNKNSIPEEKRLKNEKINFFSSFNNAYKVYLSKNPTSKELIKYNKNDELSEKAYKKNNFKNSDKFSPFSKLNLKNLKKIKFRFFHILTLLDDKDLISLLKTNKSLNALINASITNAYFFKIRREMAKYKNIFELLKCSFLFTELKNSSHSFKIDFIINIRFINKNKIEADQNKEELIPKCIQLFYFYQLFKSQDSKLKTKINSNPIEMHDYYSFDLYPNGYKIPEIYILKEAQQLFDKKENYISIQSILPFKFDDKANLKLEIYNNKNGFINPSSIRIFIKQYYLKDYFGNFYKRDFINLRICEYEGFTTHWKSLNKNNETNAIKNLKDKLKERFEPYFIIENIYFSNQVFLIYKVILKAKIPGIIDNKKIGNIYLVIKKENETIENEIKKK